MTEYTWTLYELRTTEGFCKEFLADLSSAFPENGVVPDPHLYVGAKQSLRKRRHSGYLTYEPIGNGYGRVRIWMSSKPTKHDRRVKEYLGYFGFERKETVKRRPV